MSADHEGEPNAIETCCLCGGPVGDSRHVTCVPASLTEPDRVSWTCNACAGPQLSRRAGPAWDADGQPLNLEAAAMDALDWLDFVSIVKSARAMGAHPYAAYARATEALRRFLPPDAASRAPETETTL